jgi:putative flavoprotein involved in K+ transport
MLEKTPNVRVQAFLDKFGAALEAGRIDEAVSMFADDCYWRDLVAFTWNIKTVEGHDQVRDMLQSQLQLVKPTKWLVAAGETATEADGVTESWISFETEVARGYGLIRLKGGKIWTLLTVMSELVRILAPRHGRKSARKRPAHSAMTRSPMCW